jgi:aminopeptidase N
MKRTCALAFSGDVKSQDAPFLLARCIGNKYHGTIAWAAVQENWDYANQTFPGNTIVRMVSTMTTLNTPELEAQVTAFFSEHPIPQATKTLEQALERQKVNVSLRSRESAAVLSALG